MKALVVGCAGQDGYYLSRQLTQRGQAVWGVDRQGVHAPDGTTLPPLDLTRPEQVAQLIDAWRFDRIYYLAAYHHAAEESVGCITELMRGSLAVHCQGWLNMLEAMVRYHPTGRLFYAASSHIFGVPDHSPQTEETPFRSVTPYGITKATGVQMGRMMRARHGLFCCAGILYNHESPRRQERFLTRRIVRTAVAIAHGLAQELVVGDLNARTDWGYAPEYTDAMIRILECDHPDDYIVATGRLHSVQEFLAAVFSRLDLDWRESVREDPTLLQKVGETARLVGDGARLKRATGWEPTRDLEHLAGLLVDAERQKGFLADVER